MSSTRRKIDSPIGGHEDFRHNDLLSTSSLPAPERKSVFERLGPAPITRTIDTRRVLVPRDYEETDLRFKVGRKRGVASPTCSSTSSSQQQTTSSSTQQKLHIKSVQHKDEGKVKSLVLAPKRSPSPHHQSVTSSSSSKRSNISSSSIDQRMAAAGVGKWDDDEDDEELERKRQQLQKELQELEISGADDQNPKTESAPVLSSVCATRSRSSSTFSSESGSYSSTIKSLSKSESTCSSSAKDPKSLNREGGTGTKIVSTSQRVSSSISRKNKPPEVDSLNSRNKSNEVKFDRHGNIRVSLEEQERQKRLRAERFSQKRPSPHDKNRKKTDQNEMEAKAKVKDSSRSPPSKRAKKSDARIAEEDPQRSRRHLDTRSDDHKSKLDFRGSRHESPRNKSPERLSRKKRNDDIRIKDTDRSAASSLHSHSSLSLSNYEERRGPSKEKRYTDREPYSSQDRRKATDGHFSRDHSPTHSSHSKFSRASSLGSDSSRRSQHTMKSTVCERVRSQDHCTDSHNFDTMKDSERKFSGPIIDEMSPISTTSTIPEFAEMDSNSDKKEMTSSNDTQEKEAQSPISNHDPKMEDESDANFSDWSEGEDELLLQTDGFETLDEVGNTSETTQEKDLWNDRKAHDSQDSCEDISQSQDDALEAISDDELDAIIGESEPVDSTIDSQHSSSRKQMLDALEIDWASLMTTEPKTKMDAFVPGSARKRFTPANVLTRIGFSHAFAGPFMTNKLIEFCQHELKDDFVPFRHPIAAVHALINERIRERRFLFQVDSHSTALSGRKDIQIRKLLNKSTFKIFENINTTNANNDDCSLNPMNARECSVGDVLQC